MPFEFTFPGRHSRIWGMIEGLWVLRAQEEQGLQTFEVVFAYNQLYLKVQSAQEFI